MSYLDDKMRQVKRTKSSGKRPISEERALIRRIIREEHITDKELAEILLREQRKRAEALAEETRQQEAQRVEAEARKLAEAKRVVEEARRLEETKRAEEEARRLEEAKRAAEEAHKLEEAKKAEEEARKLEETKKAEEEARKLEEAKKVEETCKLEETEKIEEEISQLVEVETEEACELVEVKQAEALLVKKNNLEAARIRREKRRLEEEKRQEKERVKQVEEAKATDVSKKSIWRELLEWLIYIAIIVGLTFLVVTFVGVKTKVSGSSMETTLHDNDNLIVDKLSYRFSEPERYDVVVFPYEYEEDVFYIKRIIGMPGETIQIIDGEVYIDGNVLESDTYGAEPIENPGIAEDPIDLGVDEYFVLGDNRNHSADSREQSVGVLSGDDLLGKAFLRIWPLSQFGVIGHE